MTLPPQPQPTIVDLIRHGRPAGGERYRGSVDDPLSEEGWRQMWAAIDGHAPWQGVITSPLQRCAAFATQVGQRLGIPVAVEPRFREMSFGRWEGRTTPEILAGDRERLISFWKDPRNNPPPGGEHLEAVRERVVAAWEELLTRHEGRHLLLVAHGGVIRVLMGHALWIPLEHLSRLLVPYAALTRLQVDKLGETTMPRLVFHHGRLG